MGGKTTNNIHPDGEQKIIDIKDNRYMAEVGCQEEDYDS